MADDTGRPPAAPAPDPGSEPAGTAAAAAHSEPNDEPNDESNGADDGADNGADTGADADPARAGEAGAESAEAAAAALSEAEAELAAQRELRERIEQRKAEKAGPISAGAKLSGQAADLLAAVRAVESGAPVDTSLLRASTPGPEPARPAPGSPRPQEAASAHRTAPAGTVSAVRAVLAEGGAPEALAGQLSATLGEQAADALREDPWRLLAMPGVRPEQADGFARALLGAACGPGDERRAAALVGWLLERAALQGHTALEASAVRGALAGHAVPDPDEAVQHAIAEGAVLVFQDGLEAEAEGSAAATEDAAGTDGAEGTEGGEEPAGTPVPVLLGLDRYALAEESLADGLARLVKTGPDASWEEAATASAGHSAAELIRAAAGHGLVLHTGGEAARAEPVALAEAARALGLRAVVAAHSENGRDRLGAEAVTVAGLLAGTEGPGRDTDGTFALDLLVVLDAPQLDVETAAMIVESLPDGSRLVLSGDPGVLWSAGAGRVFADLLGARVCPRIASRTPDAGPIGELVSGIGVGELIPVEAPGKEVVIVPVRDAGEAVHRTVQLVADSVPRAFGVAAGQTQVITVGHGGSAGTRALNAALKQRLNPGPGRFGGFDPGDRIAYVPSPGRTLQGSVVSADPDGLRLDCEGLAVVVPRERVESAVRHGWALTAHQAAGMRWPAAVVVLPGDAAQGLSRPWVYTAFSRGDRHLSVVHGVDQALPHAVAGIPSQERTTRLRPLIEGLLAPAAQPE
ncbi:helix-hairpin-helix domain-containing protein [Streptomyces sp. AK02-01A]|uniref:helix-hairpin-helix domain-containing protein n=1 Tax=Streptomyces sp. AK02-01A TaxID=3028648 RepID=UPI0029A0BC44|nr:helix-hairpin-helix domain-containing protein [Streptomyces sp. AK02-01A]MDX3850520.1 helix-hairpin-helix domain-containing protein [Streptomyces sp. AK02-01A]